MLYCVSVAVVGCIGFGYCR